MTPACSIELVKSTAYSVAGWRPAMAGLMPAGTWSGTRSGPNRGVQPAACPAADEPEQAAYPERPDAAVALGQPAERVQPA